jgi:diguanylate cyclase (GGDEF)-like protein/PAS domain S-box-containing protein
VFCNSQNERLALERQLREQLVNTGCIDEELQVPHLNESISLTRLRGKLTNQPTCNEIVWTLEDITYKNLHKENVNLAAMVYQVSNAAMLIMDTQFKILNINPAFTDHTGFKLVDIKGKPIGRIYDFPTSHITLEEIISSINETGVWRGELLIYRKTNDLFPGIVLINCIKRFDGRISHYVALFLDITNHKQLENELRYHAEIDPLTSLPNRKLLFQRLDSAFSSAKRFNYIVALLYLDLDGFKQINDNLGHGQGDNVLIEVAKRLTSCIREVDTAARLGGDEFVVILNGTSKEMVSDTAQRIIDSLTMKVTEKGIERQISASIGIAIYPVDSINPNTLLKYADEAMYKAKYKGKRQFCWHGNLST